MTGFDELFGDNASPPAPRKATVPKRPRSEKTEQPKLHVVDTETETSAESAPRPIAAEAKAEQQRQIAAVVDELAGLWDQVQAGAQCPGPQEVRLEEDTETSPELVARLWNQRLAEEGWRRRLFGCNVRDAVATVRERRDGSGFGVGIEAEIRPGMDPTKAIEQFQQEAIAAGMGHYGGRDSGRVGAHGGKLIAVFRRSVGAEDATEWNAAGHAAASFYADVPKARRKILYTAGLGVDKPRRAVPEVVSLTVGDRGPEIRLRLLSGQDATALAASCQGKLRNTFRCKDLTVAVDGVNLLIALNHRPPSTFPDRTPLSPQQLWRPRSRAEVLLAAKSGLLLPVGVDREGKPVMVNLRERPHVLIAGTSGAGKSTLLRLQLRALQVQLSRGGTLILADAKGADMRTVYAAGVGQNLSIETASIHRAITYAYDLMERRKLVYKQLVGRRLPDVFEPTVLVIDEFGAFAAVGLSDGAAASDKAGIQAAMIKLRHVLRQGRSLGVHVILSTQDVAKESGIDQKLLSVMRVRIMVGRPEEGSGGHLVKLFTEGERPKVKAATAHIGPNAMGLGVTVDQEGRVTPFKAFYNDSAASAAMDTALAAAGRRPRFGWEFPDDEGAWLQRTCADDGDLEPVDSIPAIALESEPGVPILGRSRFDEGSPDYDPGSPPLNSAHAEF